MIRGNLPLHFALSKGGSSLEKLDVDTDDALLPCRVHHLLDDHLPDEGDGNPLDSMHHLVRAAHDSAFEVGTIAGLSLSGMFAALRYKLLQTQRDKVRHPALETLDCLAWRLGRPRFEFAADVNEQAFEAIKAMFEGG
jgi:hypothetical protein